MTDVESENKQRMRAYIEKWNDHDVEVNVEFFPEDSDGITPKRGREICNQWFTAFPDLHHETRELAGDGDWILGRVTLTGTHEGSTRVSHRPERKSKSTISSRCGSRMDISLNSMPRRISTHCFASLA